MKQLLMTTIAIFGLALFTNAQVPNYIPTNGLVGWWPFNGNANDESLNGNNGTVNGASLTTDRYGNSGSAYFFGVNTSQDISIQNLQITGDWTISLWFLPTTSNINSQNYLMGVKCQSYWAGIGQSFSNPQCGIPSNSNFIFDGNQGCSNWLAFSQNYSLSAYNYLCVTYSSGIYTISINGQPSDSSSTLLDLDINDIVVGSRCNDLSTYNFDGSIDDIGIWNRALDSCEVKDLYFSSLGNCCNISLATQPINQSVNISNNAQFTTSTSDSLATFQWQTDLGIGFQNLNSVGQYIGTTNDTLTIVNTTLSNNNQPFRCIVSSGSCTDTSSIAVLTVVNNTGINEVSQSNLFSVYPNPASDEINLKSDVKLLGSVYTIFDNTGKFVLSGKINSENTIIEIGNLSGGIYLFSIGENLKQTFKVIKQ